MWSGIPASLFLGDQFSVSVHKTIVSENYPGLFMSKSRGCGHTQRSVEPGSSTTLPLVKAKLMAADPSNSILDKNNVDRPEPATAWKLSLKQTPLPCTTRRTLGSALESLEVLGESNSKLSKGQRE